MNKVITAAAAAIVSALTLATPASAGGSLSITVLPGGDRDQRALATGLQVYSIVQGFRSSGVIRQRGSGNSAGLAQNGSGNYGVVHQRGSGHQGTLQQNGSNNSYGLFQFGRNTQGHVVQNGHGQAGATFQFGW